MASSMAWRQSRGARFDGNDLLGQQLGQHGSVRVGWDGANLALILPLITVSLIRKLALPDGITH